MSVPAFSMQDWLADLPAPQARVMGSLCETILRVVPESTTAKHYGLPAFLLGKKGLVCLNVWAKHGAFYPMSGEIIATHAGALREFVTSKGTIQFQPDKPIPDDVLVSILRARLVELDHQSSKGVT